MTVPLEMLELLDDPAARQRYFEVVRRASPGVGVGRPYRPTGGPTVLEKALGVLAEEKRNLSPKDIEILLDDGTESSSISPVLSRYHKQNSQLIGKVEGVYRVCSDGANRPVTTYYLKGQEVNISYASPQRNLSPERKKSWKYRAAYEALVRIGGWTDHLAIAAETGMDPSVASCILANMWRSSRHIYPFERRKRRRKEGVRQSLFEYRVTKRESA